MTKDNIRVLFDQASSPAAWPEPDRALVDDGDAPAPPLETDALPAGWGDWICAEAEACNIPRDYVAGALIPAASEWIGNARHIGATVGWREPPHSWVALVGMPSTGKSPGMRSVIEATRTIEREAEPDWIGRCQEHAAKVAAAKLREDKWNSEVRAAVGKNKEPPWKPSEAEAPPAPAPFRLLTMDCTTEELQRLLADQLRGLLFVRNELAGWLGSHDKYGGNGADRAFFLEAWDGGVYVADRVKIHGKPIRIPRTSLAIFGGLQPELLRKLLTGDDDGLVARFIYLWPTPVPVADLSEDAGAAKRRDDLTAAARRLLKLQMDSDPAGAPVPRILRLTGSAFDLFQRLRREAIEKARASRGMAAGWHGKTPTRALRLALVYEMLHWAADGTAGEPRAVGIHAMERVGRFLAYAGKMFDRVTAGLAIEQDEADAALIARQILAAGRPEKLVLNERGLYRHSAWLRDRVRRADALSFLANAGWIRAARGGGNGRPRGDWEINPQVFTQGA